MLKIKHKLTLQELQSLQFSVDLVTRITITIATKRELAFWTLIELQRLIQRKAALAQQNPTLVLTPAQALAFNLLVNTQRDHLKEYERNLILKISSENDKKLKDLERATLL